jgi:hypothetical protein
VRTPAGWHWQDRDTLALASDGGLWFWFTPEVFDPQSFWPLMRPSRHPRYIGNIFADVQTE